MKFLQLVLVAVLLMASPCIFAAKPDPVDNPPLQIREQNLDPNNDAIRVSQQGTVEVDIVEGEELDVNVTNPTLDVSGSTVDVSGSTVSVDSLPEPVDVYITGSEFSPVSRMWAHYSGIDPDDSPVEFSFDTIYATTIQFSNLDDETFVTFKYDGREILNYLDAGARVPFHADSFTHPIPLNSVEVSCVNESDPCQVHVAVIGF